MSDNDKIKAEIAAKKLRLQELKDKRATRGPGPAPPPPADGKDAGGRGPAPPPPSRDLMSQIGELVGAKVKLATSVGLASHTILPQERHVYDKACQTEFGVALQGKQADMEKALRAEQEALMQKEAKLKQLEDQLKIDKQKYDHLREEERLQERKELSAEEQKRVMSSESFQNFFGKATLIVERALNQSIYDFTVDYSSNTQDQSTSRGQGLASRVVFQDKRVQNRAVTSLDWSHKHPELLLVSYSAQDDPMSLDPHGTVFVWNMHMPNRPEYIFTCNSAVLAAKFHPSQPHLILGACQSGQVVIWDTREREKTTPVNRTNLSQGHTHPVYALELVSVVNKLHNIVSMSTDGHLCVWSDNNLHQHSKEVRMKYGKEEITTTSFAFPKNSQNSLIMGSDEGWLYKGHVYDNEGIYEAFQAHKAPITTVQYHPSQKNNNLMEYYLTASFDWTVKLWSSKINRPLLTFESARDYVFDVQWSPVHPALFAMGDGSGRLDIWDISGESDVPSLTAHVDPSPGGERPAISRVSWSENGSQIAAGTSLGAVHVFVLREDLVIPNTDDASQIIDRLQKKLSE